MVVCDRIPTLVSIATTGPNRPCDWAGQVQLFGDSKIPWFWRIGATSCQPVSFCQLQSADFLAENRKIVVDSSVCR